MDMAKLKHRDKTYEVEAGKQLERAIRELGIIPETVLPVRDGKIVPLTHRLEEEEEIELVDVISGG